MLCSFGLCLLKCQWNGVLFHGRVCGRALKKNKEFSWHFYLSSCRFNEEAAAIRNTVTVQLKRLLSLIILI